MLGKILLLCCIFFASQAQYLQLNSTILISSTSCGATVTDTFLVFVPFTTPAIAVPILPQATLINATVNNLLLANTSIIPFVNILLGFTRPFNGSAIIVVRYRVNYLIEKLIANLYMLNYNLAAQNEIKQVDIRFFFDSPVSFQSQCGTAFSNGVQATFADTKSVQCGITFTEEARNCKNDSIGSLTIILIIAGSILGVFALVCFFNSIGLIYMVGKESRLAAAAHAASMNQELLDRTA